MNINTPMFSYMSALTAPHTNTTNIKKKRSASTLVSNENQSIKIDKGKNEKSIKDLQMQVEFLSRKCSAVEKNAHKQKKNQDSFVAHSKATS